MDNIVRPESGTLQCSPCPLYIPISEANARLKGKRHQHAEEYAKFQDKLCSIYKINILLAAVRLIPPSCQTRGEVNIFHSARRSGVFACRTNTILNELIHVRKVSEYQREIFIPLHLFLTTA